MPRTALLPLAVRSIDLAPDIFSSLPQLSCSRVRVHTPKSKKGRQTPQGTDDGTGVKADRERQKRWAGEIGVKGIRTYHYWCFD